MERWKWRMDDLRSRGEREEIDRRNGCGCYSILTDQSEGDEICILSTMSPIWPERQHYNRGTAVASVQCSTACSG